MITQTTRQKAVRKYYTMRTSILATKNSNGGIFYKTMIIIEYATFFKVLVIKPDIFGSEIVNEQHFATQQQAEQFKKDILHKYDDVICVICKM